VESFGGDIRAFHGGTFPGLWVLQIGQAFGLMPGGFSPGLPPPILEKANRSQGRGAKPWATRGLVRSRQPATERVNANCREAFRLTFDDDEVRTNR